MKAVVIGSGRCGSRAVARWLSASGRRAGFEDVFTTEAVTAGGPFDWGDFTVDVSWRAMPVVPLPGVQVVQLVRHPLDVITSMVALGFHDDAGARAVVGVGCPNVYLHDSPHARAAHHWLAWNARLDNVAGVRWRIEDLGLPVDPNTWTARSVTPRAGWSDLPAGLATVVRSYARRYGYGDA